MDSIWSNGLFSIAVYLLAVILFGVVMSWAVNHIGSDVVKIVKDAVKENAKEGQNTTTYR